MMKKHEDFPETRQLEMNFEGTHGNRFKEQLDNAVFNVLIELRVPGRDSRIDAVVSKYSELESVVSAQKWIPCGLAFLDDSPAYPSLNLGEFASALCKTGRDRHLLYVHGRDRSAEEIAYDLGLYRFEGFRNIAAVSGAPGEDLAETGKHRYLESVNILQWNAASEQPLFAGCVANPFKYTRTDCMAQMFKLTKKIAAGASFVVTQCGWDMRKLLEMRWCMFRRMQNIPTIARIMFLTPDKAEDICSGKCPGIHISDDFKQAIRKEMMHSLAQFEAAQWRRLQIHAAGAKFLGYSGVQIAGVDRPETAQRIFVRIEEAMKEFQTYEDWRIAHNDYYSRIEMAPYPYRYYMFESMLAEGVTCENAKVTNEPLPVCSTSERLKYRLGRLLLSHADRMPPREKRITKKLLASCRGGCEVCHLPQNLYVCSMNCPKHMIHGPCCETEPSGNCHFTGKECIHASKIRRAVFANDYAPLEEWGVGPAGRGTLGKTEQK